MDLPEHREFLKYLVGIDCMYDAENVVRQAVKKLDTDILMCSVPYTPADPEKI